MNTPTAFNPRLRRFKRLHRAVLTTLAAIALAACGGGGMDDEALTSPASAAGQPLRAGRHCRQHGDHDQGPLSPTPMVRH
jgi:hypothetical protein